ncbi:hypothetical protein ED28_01180 [[Pantoea] beijingensis]|uniref:Ribonuclease n=1 Tax=[Pantoea] beijingensis TaxID=1324864 RepID=A0A443IHY4_9GAMM|nr:MULTISPECIES: ribonuclease domain-containing protein [Erwiniaceae]RWR03629.1 hypothetical protein ED28_01180 [[Pantoea] beijingensis]
MNKRLWIALAVAIVAAIAGVKQPQHKTPPVSSSAPQQQRETIATLTQQQRVARYLQQHQQLPDYYLTKNQARRQGWDPAKGNLCSLLPGKAIGGDRFSNREGLLPVQRGRIWFEADVNYQCGHRNADRLLYSSDGLIFVSTDHYRSVKKVN